jgi:hypothetical protein
MVVDVYNKYGDFINGSPVEGLLIADFASSVTETGSKIRNTTDGADVTLTTVTESTSQAGRYTLAYTSQTVSDVLQPYVKKNGLDGTTMIGTTGTVV